MSRLRALHIPFAQGFSDEVDAKLLPDGVLHDLRNGRVSRSGVLQLRRGWRPVVTRAITGSGGSLNTPDEVVDVYSTSRGLVALVAKDGEMYVQAFTNHSAATPWVGLTNQRTPPATRVRSVGRMSDLGDSVDTASSAVTADGVWGATLEQTASAGRLRIFRLDTDETRLFRSVGTNTAKIVSLGSTFGLVQNTGTALELTFFDPASSTIVNTAVTTLRTVTASHFDVAVAVETTPTRIHLVYTASGAVTYRQYTTAGVEQGSGKTVSASGAQGAWVASDDVTAHVVFQDATTDEVSLLSFAATGAFTTSAGPTALNAGTDYEDGRVAIGYTPNEPTPHVWIAGDATGATDLISATASAHGSITIVRHESSQLTAGWVTRGAYAGVGLVRGPAGSRDAWVADTVGPWLVAGVGLASNPPNTVSPWGVGQAPSGDALMLWPRRSDATAATSLAAGEIATRQAGSVAFRVFDTDARRLGAEFGGVLYLAGGVLTQVDAGVAVENGMLRPIIDGLAQANSTGSLANGTYQYRAVVVWTDGDGRVHRSPVSAPEDIVVSGTNDTVTATVHVARTLRRRTDAPFTPTVELYRTEAGPGELFYHVASQRMNSSNDSVDVVDTLADADILDNPRLYTEGEFGAVSGALDITMPNPSAFVAAVRDRLVTAAPEPSYQISQTLLPEEPVAFTQPGFSGPAALSYQDTVEGDITALAALDQTIVIGTARSVFLTTAEGGPNLAGVGEFPSPSRLPSDVGIPNAASLVEDANGLWFIGDSDGAGERLYLLARGQSAPIAQLAARDRFGAGTVVGGGVDTTDDATCWAVADGADSVLVSRHAQAPNPWAADDLPFEPRAAVAHGGGLYAVDSVGGLWTNTAGTYGDGTSGATAVALQAETGDVQAFGGVSGYGRLGAIEVLGEYQSDATLGLEISYDSGGSWTAVGTPFTVSGLSAGSMFQRQWRPARQRAGRFRLRVTMTPASTTAEGCRLAGLSLYYRPATGPTRLGSAKRR